MHRREHFVYSRLDEVERIRSLPEGWRGEEFRQSVAGAEQLAAKLFRSIPEANSRSLEYLNVWSRVYTELQETRRQRVAAGG